MCGLKHPQDNRFCGIKRLLLAIGPKDFSTFSIYKIYVKYGPRWRGCDLRISIILALMLISLAPNACAFGSSGSVVVDIIGSRTDNTRIAPNGIGPVELEIIGSTANNTTIGLQGETKIICPECTCPECICPEKKCVCEQEKKPWDGLHLGVDAWYGAFWYTDINMPKWPQI